MATCRGASVDFIVTSTPARLRSDAVRENQTPVTITIRNVPEPLVEGLRARAKDNHRSLQEELLVILEEALKRRRLRPDEVHQIVLATGLKTPAESVEIIRAERDAR